MKCLQLVALLLLLCGSSFAQAKVPVDYFVRLLNQGKYEIVYDSIQHFRDKTPYGKSPTLDYLEAKCLCMNGTCENAYYIFNKIFDCYSLSKADKEFLIGEIASCKAPEHQVANLPPQTVVVIPAQSLNFSAGVHGKMGAVYNCQDKSQFIDLSGLPSGEVMAQRIFNKEQKKDARQYWLSLLGSEYRVDTNSNRWVIVTRKDASSDKINQAVTAIQRTADFYSSFYHLSIPEKLITVFMLPDIGALQKAASKVHHIALSSSSLGYSNPYDLCLMGISDISHTGTINHELFHLMIKADIGDMPAWLDEGLACLYATAVWRNDTLKGSDTWRTDVLRKSVHDMRNNLPLPTVKMLIRYSWSDFNSTEEQNICRVAINYALANHLMLYFQEKRLLQKIVDAYRNRPAVSLNKVGYYPSNTELLEKAVNEPVDSLQKHFFKWLYTTYSINTSNRVMQTYIENLDDILEDCINSYTAMLVPGKDQAVADKLLSRQQALKNEYYAKWYRKEEERKFYDTEEQQRRGLHTAFADSSSYQDIKKVYDAAIVLRKEMQEVLFKK